MKKIIAIILAVIGVILLLIGPIIKVKNQMAISIIGRWTDFYISCRDVRRWNFSLFPCRRNRVRGGSSNYAYSKTQINYSKRER